MGGGAAERVGGEAARDPGPDSTAPIASDCFLELTDSTAARLKPDERPTGSGALRPEMDAKRKSTARVSLTHCTCQIIPIITINQAT